MYKPKPLSPVGAYEAIQRILDIRDGVETLRSTAYEKLLPPLVAKIREEVHAWRQKGYHGASARPSAPSAGGSRPNTSFKMRTILSLRFRYYFAQREAVETLIWLYDVHRARDKFDLLRFDASRAASSGMFDEEWPRYVLKMATGAGKTKGWTTYCVKVSPEGLHYGG